MFNATWGDNLGDVAVTESYGPGRGEVVVADVALLGDKPLGDVQDAAGPNVVGFADSVACEFVGSMRSVVPRMWWAPTQ